MDALPALVKILSFDENGRRYAVAHSAELSALIVSWIVDAVEFACIVANAAVDDILPLASSPVLAAVSYAFYSHLLKAQFVAPVVIAAVNADVVSAQSPAAMFAAMLPVESFVLTASSPWNDLTVETSQLAD